MHRGFTVAATLLAVALAPSAAEAKVKPRVKVSPSTVVAGNVITIKVTGTQKRRCTFTVRAAVHGARATVTRRTRSTRVRFRVPANTAAGDNIARVACGARSAGITFHVVVPAPPAGTPGQGDAPVPISEQLHLTDDLPDGEGSPNDYAVTGLANAGGAGFSSYWPFATGVSTTISQGQNGGCSHGSVYTHDAIDLAVGQGTEIRAGFNGVIARVSRGCVVGNYSCGSGYGNYVYLKAATGRVR